MIWGLNAHCGPVVPVPFSPGPRPAAAARRAGNLGANPSTLSTADACAASRLPDSALLGSWFHGLRHSFHWVLLGCVVGYVLYNLLCCTAIPAGRRTTRARLWMHRRVQDLRVQGVNPKPLLVFILWLAMALALAHAQHEPPRRRATDCKHKHRRLRTCSRTNMCPGPEPSTSLDSINS